jgi:DDE superfamily endonuclease
MLIGQLMIGRLSFGLMSLNSIWLARMGVHGVGEGQEFDARFAKKVVKHGGGNVMVWGCLTAKGVGWICCIEGNMNAALYTEILDDELLGTLHDLKIKKKDIYFQQDNDPKHTSNLATNWFQKKKLNKLDWPPNSPDMNVIEHLWDYLDRKVRL